LYVRAVTTQDGYVLVADSDGDVCEIVRAILAEAGHRVECAHDADQALRQIDIERPSVAVVDIQLRGTANGSALLAAIASHGVRVVAMSAAANAGDLLSQIPYSGLRKPFRVKTLLALVSGGAEISLRPDDRC
jgi:two-component system, NtrC family, response regulator HydG